jgi:hypothetical protein
MIELLPPLGLNKYDTWRILLVKCYIDNYVHLRSCIRNANTYRGKNRMVGRGFRQLVKAHFIGAQARVVGHGRIGNGHVALSGYHCSGQ